MQLERGSGPTSEAATHEVPSEKQGHLVPRCLHSQWQVVLATLKAASAWDAQRFVADPLTFYAERDGTDVMKKDGLTLELKRGLLEFVGNQPQQHGPLDHQRRLFLDLASYVEALPLPTVLPIPEKKNVFFALEDADGGRPAARAESDGDLRRTGDTSRPSVLNTRRSETYNLAKEVSEKQEALRIPSRSKSFEKMSHCRRTLRDLVDSWQFESFFALVIITNSVFIGVTIQLESMEESIHDKNAIFALQLVYSGLFTLELTLRILAVGLRRYFCARHTAWNWFDAAIVASALYELLTILVDRRLSEPSIASSAGSNLRILRVLRLTRLTRVFRVLRVVRFVRPLQTLVHSIFHTVKALLWALLLLGLINYMFAILFTDVVNGYVAEQAEVTPTVLALRALFGTLQHSTLTTLRLQWFRLKER
ncbi:Sodium channel protein type 4 subunit alpha B (Voltage-gated sodium channel subunit alpha Nav1.4b) [Durusdinium trenchii]|uniref:Sodium channel protein type 4 subunit alpha B (Voltage-gated sodium channel subunit alpha Nav1.4b) n=1 Tax=Durusdinium trenchii TaxID=1381693 RepID=A0ABP0L0G8_9DINO